MSGRVPFIKHSITSVAGEWRQFDNKNIAKNKKPGGRGLCEKTICAQLNMTEMHVCGPYYFVFALN